MFKNIKRGIKNIIYWLPIIWKDRDWDYYYIYIVLKHKLQNLHDGLTKRNLYVNVEHDTKYIRLCINLINKLTTDYYETEYLDYFKTNDTFEPTVGRNSKSFILVSVIIEDNSEEYFKKYPLIVKKLNLPKETPEERKTLALRVAQKNHARAKKLLFDILNNKIEYWWD